MVKKDQDLIEKFFSIFPVCHAIPRINEALVIKTIKLIPPVLDLGCGDGKFALLAFGKKEIDVGLDQDRKALEKAEKSGAYKKVVYANAEKMPFEKKIFYTVIANSVLEHVTNLDLVLREIHRVLNRGGILILTVPTPLVCHYLFFSKFIPFYAFFKRKIWRHINYFGERQWLRKLKNSGFKVESIRKTNSKNAILWADIFFPLTIFGPIKWVINFLEKRKIFGENKNGATLVITAKKE